MLPISRTTPHINIPSALRPIVVARLYATQTGLGTTTPKPRRKAVTAFNDDGRVAWGELSAREKVARTTQQTFNFSMLVVGAVLTGGVAYFMYTDVFSPDSKTSHFNRAVDQVKRDSRCIELLGDSKKITAYGEPTWNKWRRARPIASTIQKDQRGVEHLKMHFNVSLPRAKCELDLTRLQVEGPLNTGVVNLHMIKRPSDHEFVYKYLAVDVKGHPRIWLENADTKPDSPGKSKTRFFGVEWTR
ncbi:TIM21-domain-containing protein [Xylogone sp. PMI_703]|nr:TIM21-domain-containing protein [Xylogone sp. PMI_703]